MFKLGFVGFGKSANRYHSPFIDVIEQIEVVGYYDQGSNFNMNYPYKHKLISFESVEDLFSAVDIVVICTSIQVHFEYAKKAIEAGCHVICEKPVVPTVHELNELYQLAQDNNVVFTPYQNRRFDSDFTTIKHILETKNVGTVIDFQNNHSMNRQDRIMPKDKIEKYAQMERSVYGGMVYGHAVHFIDQIVSIYGKPDSIIYDKEDQINYFINDTETRIMDDYYAITLKYGRSRMHHSFYPYAIQDTPRFVINTVNATIINNQLDTQEDYLKQGIFLDNPQFGINPNSSNTTIYYKDGTIEQVDTVYGGYQLFYDNFVKAVNGEEELLVTQEQATTVLSILEQVVSS